VSAGAYPQPWGLELVRNGAGRAFWYVSRFIARTQVEYVTNIAGEPICYRSEREALAALAQANDEAAERPPQQENVARWGCDELVTIRPASVLWRD
jgi:hypothetical protein